MSDHGHWGGGDSGGAQASASGHDHHNSYTAGDHYPPSGWHEDGSHGYSHPGYQHYHHHGYGYQSLYHNEPQGVWGRIVETFSEVPSAEDAIGYLGLLIAFAFGVFCLASGLCKFLGLDLRQQGRKEGHRSRSRS